ncbi:MAG: TRAP transporter small permease subunit [Proteobacteria bacterium]|nr:TRAP transporter small permease subunit [Pseudomonadota bacterium]
MQRIIDFIDKLIDRIGRTASWLAFAMVLLVVVIVTLRYVFQFGSIALQESVMYVNALIFSLGAAYTLKEQGHVRVDILYSRLSERGKALVDLLGAALFLLPSTVFIIWVSWDYVSVSWQIRERSPDPSGLSYVYLLKATILVLAGLLIVQGSAEALKALRKLRQSRT